MGRHLLDEINGLRRASECDCEAIIDLITCSFHHDPLQKIVYANIGAANEIFRIVAKLQVPFCVGKGDVFMVPETDKAILVGQTSKQIGFMENISMLGQAIRANKEIKAITTLQERKMIELRLKDLKNVSNEKWANEFIKVPYYHVDIIAIDRSLKGTGVLRRFLDPLYEACSQKGMACVMETHNPDNVPIYEHFNFKLVKTLENKEYNIKQYCFIKHPRVS